MRARQPDEGEGLDHPPRQRPRALDPTEHLDTGQPRINHYHHPQEYLAEPGADDDDGERPGAA